MKLALVNPPYSTLVEPLAYPPANLGYLAAMVRRRCQWVTCDLLNLAGHRPEEAELALRDYDIVGYTSTSPYYASVVELARRIARPSLRQIIGGAHVSATREHDDVFDAVFVGDGEETLVKYLQDVQAGGPTRREYYGGHTDLDTLPFPEYDLVPRLNYGGGSLSAIMFGSRGCPYNCSYCATRRMNGRVRFRSVGDITRELAWLRGRGVSDVRWMDDCFLARPGRALDICERMAPLGLTWGCLIRVSHADYDLFSAMKKAGCTDVAVGVESFDQHVLDVLRKGTRVEQSRDCLNMLADVGLKARVFMMTSTPGETARTTALNISGLESASFYRVILSTFMPFPGCDIWESPERFGVQIVERDCSRYVFHMWQKVEGKVRRAGLWSPIRIDGMSEAEQMARMQALREYVCGLGEASIEIPAAEVPDARV